MAYTVPLEELDVRATRARGPGGQHVNTTATRVEVRWSVAASPSLTEAQRERLLHKLARRIDRRGVLRVVAAERRSQWQNRRAAIARLRKLVKDALVLPKPRKKTKPPASARERRLADKQHRSKTKRQRGRVKPED
jgi:ribosome-associated protein